MRVLPFLVIISLFVSCRNLEEKEREGFVSKVERIGINNFKHIEYGTRGHVECYNLCFVDNSFASWTYDRKKDQFEYPLIPHSYGKSAEEFKIYIENLRDNIKSLDVLMISQSSWCGEIVRFWISNEEIIEYVDSEFEFNTNAKKNWQSELISGKLIKENWYYIKIESNERDK